MELISQPISSWKSIIKNDFETVAFKKHEELRLLKEKFYLENAIYSSMSGSGSVIYGIFEK